MSIAEMSPEQRGARRREAIASPEAESPIPTGIYFPIDVLTNEQIELLGVRLPNGELLTDAKLTRNIGVRIRHIARDNETVIDMGAAAAEKVLKGNKDIDAVLASTSYPIGRHIAGSISAELGLHPKFIMDFYAACSGHTAALHYLKEHEKQFSDKKILLLSTEKPSPYLEKLNEPGAIERDPSMTQAILTDGSTASILDPDKIDILSTSEYDLENRNYIEMPIDRSLMVPPYFALDIPVSKTGKFRQLGPQVFGQVKRRLPSLIRATAQTTEAIIKDVIPHQGSKRVVMGVQEELPEYELIQDYEEGNMSSASVPKALKKWMEEHKGLTKGATVVLAGFGAGLAAYTVVVRFKK